MPTRNPPTLEPSKKVPSPKRSIPGATSLKREGRIALWYVAIVLGIVARAFYDDYMAYRFQELSLSHLLVSSIIAAVIFPLVWEKFEPVSKIVPTTLQLFMCFQAGFFWETVFGSLARVAPTS